MRLFEFELTWANAAFDAVYPDHPALPHGIATLRPEVPFAEVVARSPLEQAIGLRAALWLVALAPLVVLLRPATIASAEPDERQRVFAALLACRVYFVRQLAVALKATAGLLYAQSVEVCVAMRTPRPIAVTQDMPVPLESGVVAVHPEKSAQRQNGGVRAA
jgi:hypothetical protein